ncbi:DUF1569 domain-containing protein [Gaopeijia maritima]|uniref:DUF1569 domain-containing protein n=1 Tax=Gaopeijia maritima TaxID=3119007 RepID=A0ABU9E9S6_9BACT
MPLTPHPDLPDAATLSAAAARLESTTRPQWGRMSAPQMVEHCARFNEIYLGRQAVSPVVRLLARMFGGLFIKKFLRASPFEMQRNMKTLPELQMTSEPAEPDHFEADRARLLATLAEIESITGRWKHPLYGTIDAEVGRALTRHHLAHHLHQFGVLEPASST